MNIREILQNSIRAQQRGLLDIPDEVAEVVKKVFSDIKEDKTLGRASEGSWGHLDGYVNVIPSKRKGICTPILITLCYDKDSFEGRIFESLDHAVKVCPNECRHVFLITTQWNSVVVNKLSGYIEAVRKNGVDIRMIYVTQNGAVAMPI